MEYIVSFLSNNIIIAWVAPIVTTIVATVVIKLFSIRRKNKEIKAANQKYADAIRPYIIQQIVINEDMIHGIRNAISIQTSIPEKHLYSDITLRNILMYDITETRFMTEEGKNSLIQNIIDMFNFNKDDGISENSDNGKVIDKKEVMLGTFAGVLGLVASVIIYYINPEKANDPNSVVVLFILLPMMFSLLCLVSVTWAVLDIKLEADIENEGLIGNILYAERKIAQQIIALLLGNKRYRQKNNEKIKDEEQDKIENE